MCAAFIADAENTRIATGTATGRVSVRELELPLLDTHTSDRLRQALANLETVHGTAAEVAARTEQLHDILLSAIGSGDVELR